MQDVACGVWLPLLSWITLTLSLIYLQKLVKNISYHQHWKIISRDVNFKCIYIYLGPI